MSNCFHFRVGDFACAAISDGGFNYPVESFFKDVPPGEARVMLEEQGLPTTHINSPYTLLYIDTGKNKIMVDTGMGRYGSLADKMFPDIDNSTTQSGTLLANMRAGGINPADVDLLIITHAHPDHIGGNLDADGRLAFPNARAVIWEREWAFWFSDDETAALQASAPMIQIARANLEPLRDGIIMIDKEEEIVSGISAVATPGHTPGHIAVSINSQGEHLIHLSDAAVHPLHLELPDSLLEFDMIAEQTLTSRRMICRRASEEQALVFGHHMPPFPSLGHIRKHLDEWRWEPISA